MGKGKKFFNKTPPAESQDMFESESDGYEEDDGETQVTQIIDDSIDHHHLYDEGGDTLEVDINSQETEIGEGSSQSQALEVEDEGVVAVSGDEGAAASPRRGEPPKKRSRRIYSAFNEATEINLAEWYQENPCLYDKKLTAYRDKPRKEKVWEDKALLMNTTAAQLRLWVSNMRTRYAKLVDMKSGMANKKLTQRDRWIKDTFLFLRPHIVRCPTRTSKVKIVNVKAFFS